MIHQIKSFFVASDIDDPVIQKEVQKASLVRTLIATCGAILFSASVISAFYHNRNNGTLIEIQWRTSIIQLNSCMILINTCLAALALYTLRYKKPNGLLYAYLPYALLIVIGGWGIAGSVFHQLISWTISPFIMACFVFVMLLIRPVVFMYYFAFLYIVFYFFIPVNQSNPNYVLLNRALGFGILLISYCLSLLTWNNNLVRFRQNRLIELQTEALKESNASKDKFFSILSHDLKGPVATSLLLTELLQEDHVGEQERKEIQQLFRSSLENISRLLNNVLLWANNQTGNIGFNPVDLELKAIIDEDIQLLHAMAIQKNIKVINEVSKNFILHADHHMLRTIIRNLLTNAIKFTHSEGKVLISAEQVTRNNLPFSKLAIVDNGIGISPALLVDLFKLDKKIMTPGTHNETGTGLGLILCKDFIEKHKGKLLVESEELSGSCFTVLLPIQ
ncbi:MAG: HAMP domain-containing histidine kinase [Cytophagaceae bacterium]|nr:HAMP domain-containing histidine kinase [Cytophagaceae bacterium]